MANYQTLIKKVERVVNKHELDLSSGEDLSVGVMNLIAIEEHLFFTAQKLKSPKSLKYLKLLNEVRLMRTGLLKKIVKNYEGEEWCIGKHLLAASMRLMEVGTKELKKAEALRGSERAKRFEEAQDLFKKSYHLYSLFWGLNLNAVKVSEVAQVSQEVNYLDEKGKLKGSVSVFDKLGSLITKALNCCKE